MIKAIGIDLGGTNVNGVLINETGDILHRIFRSIDHNASVEDDGHWKNIIKRIVGELKSKGQGQVKTIGLAAPGVPNKDNTCIQFMPGRLVGLENLNWGEFLHEERIWVANDAHAALMAEARFGVGKGFKNIVMLTLGTGVGGGIMINGELYQGDHQIAGHLGHMALDAYKEDPGITGMPGTLENAMGDDTVSKRSFGRFQSTKDLVEAYKNGDNFATFIWLDSVRKLALGLCSLDNILSPDLFILGGGITKSGEALYQPLADFMNIYKWKNMDKETVVKQAYFDDNAGGVGAAGFALAQFGSGANIDI